MGLQDDRFLVFQRSAPTDNLVNPLKRDVDRIRKSLLRKTVRSAVHVDWPKKVLAGAVPEWFNHGNGIACCVRYLQTGSNLSASFENEYRAVL